MGIFGVTVPSSNVADVLRGNNKWSQAYGNVYSHMGGVNEALKVGSDKLLFDMAKTNALYQNQLSSELLAAYESAFNQQTEILGSNLGQGYKQAGVSEIDDALNSAYESYILNYRQNKIANEQATSDAIANLEEVHGAEMAKVISAETQLENAIMEEAEDFSEFYNSIPGYFEWLYSQEDDTGILDEIFGKSDWSGYRDAEGNFIGTESLSETMYGFDEEGNRILNEEGDRVFRQAIYELSGRGLDNYSYAKYLESTGQEELAKWLYSQNTYDWTPPEGVENSNLNYALSQLGVTSFGYRWDVPFEEIRGIDNPSTRNREFSNYFNDNLEVTGASKIVVDNNGITNKYNNDTVGTMSIYNTNDGTIIAFDNLEIKNNSNIRDVDGDNFQMTYNGNNYRFEIASSKNDNSRLTSDSNIYNQIERTVGGLKENHIYSYNGDIYVAITSKDGSMILRKLQRQGVGGWKSKSYDSFVDIVNNTDAWGNPYDINSITSNKTGPIRQDPRVRPDFMKPKSSTDKWYDDIVNAIKGGRNDKS